ncbi:MAG: acyl-CoA desaturase, partial [Akkermansiaceae bacterium]|nr:acyl-CoA desaturase [Akkermansiaceae bacterium]
MTKPKKSIFRLIGEWWDSDYQAEDAPDPSTLPDKVDWERTLPFIFLHIGCLAVFWVGISPVVVIAAIALYIIRMFAITGFYHRYFSHRTYKTSRTFQFILALIGNSSMQRGSLWWAAT